MKMTLSGEIISQPMRLMRVVKSYEVATLAGYNHQLWAQVEKGLREPQPEVAQRAATHKFVIEHLRDESRRFWTKVAALTTVNSLLLRHPTFFQWAA